MESTSEPSCFKCQTTLNVSEVGKGIYCCRGFCLKIFNNQKERLQARVFAADSTSPWQTGGFCRAVRFSDGKVLNCSLSKPSPLRSDRSCFDPRPTCFYPTPAFVSFSNYPNLT